MTLLKADNTYRISISRLDRYKTCAHFFLLDTIQKIPYEAGLEKHFLLGQWAHQLLEAHLKRELPINKTSFLISWLSQVGLDQVVPLADAELVMQHLGELYLRASSRAPHGKAIRTTKREIPKDIQVYPTKEVSEVVAQLYPFIGRVDTAAAQANPFFERISLSWLLGEVWGLGYYYRIPSFVEEVLGVELPLEIEGKPPLTLHSQRTNSLYEVIGFIDCVLKINNGSGGQEIAIIDHKTGKECPTPSEVKHNYQLNLYAWAYEKLTGLTPTVIGIHHVRTGNYVLSRINQTVNTEIINNIISLSDAAYHSSIYPKHRPSEYQSACVHKDWRTGLINSTCPYLSKCWPIFYEESVEQPFGAPN